MQTRRTFLTATSAALAASILPGSVLAQSPLPQVFTNANVGAYGQGLLTQATFERLIGSTFTVFVDTGLYAFLTLRSVKNMAVTSAAPALAAGVRVIPAPGRGKAAPAVTSFFLDFSIRGPVFPQGTYTIDHGTLGRFAAFLVPGKSPTDPSCGATFCYIAS